jgi:hypothetical protein
MAQTLTIEERLALMKAENSGLDAAHARAAKTALLEHARMGRCVYESHQGTIVEITPEEIFARYGLDANGRPPAQ